MTDEDIAELRKLQWMPSRIPPLDALTIFRPTGSPDPDPVLNDTLARMGRRSRWYPQADGVRGVMPYQPGEPYDSSRFTRELKAWDFDDCDMCVKRIPATTLCWVPRSGPNRLLCTDCYDRNMAPFMQRLWS